MNLMHLRYFCKLAETENYTVASTELYISQPGLSGAIASLEQELGLRLFEKKGRNIKLTKYGREFYVYVNQALEILDNGIAVMHEYGGKLGGKIDIGAITTIQSSYLPRVISDFRSAYENINFYIYQGQSEGILEGIRNGNYDIGFCTYDESLKDMKGVPILTQKVVAAVPEDHPLAQKENVHLDDLAPYRILTYSLTQQIGRQFKMLLEGRGDTFAHTDVVYEYPNELYLAGVLIDNEKTGMSVAGDGTFIGDSAVGLMAYAPYLDNFSGIKILDVVDVSEDFRVVYMIYDEKHFHTHAVSVFIKFIESYYSLKGSNPQINL